MPKSSFILYGTDIDVKQVTINSEKLNQPIVLKKAKDNTAKQLGVTFDSDMSWEPMIEEVKRKSRSFEAIF